MKSKIIIGLIIVVIIIGGGIMIASRSTPSPTPQVTSTPVATTTPLVSTVKIYTLADIATHATSTDCWTTVSAKVYNLTSWISQHPGGSEAILWLCGIDGTTGFMNQHGGQGKPEGALASFYIGDLKK